MSFPAFNNVAPFTPGQQIEIEQFVSYVVGYLTAQHKDDGSHSAVTADSVAVSGNQTVGGSLVVGTTISIGVSPNPTFAIPVSGDLSFAGTSVSLTGTSNHLTFPVSSPVLGEGITALTYDGSIELTTNNRFVFGKTSGGAGSYLIGIDSTDHVSIDGSALGVVFGSSIRERFRTTPMGEWIDVTYASGNFTSSSGTWTVDSGDQILYRYTLIGKTMILAWEIDTTTVSGGQAALRIAIPGGFTAAKSTFVGGLVYMDNGAAFVQSGTMFTNAGQGFVGMQPGALGAGTWSAATNNTSVRGVFTFEIT